MNPAIDLILASLESLSDALDEANARLDRAASRAGGDDPPRPVRAVHIVDPPS